MSKIGRRVCAFLPLLVFLAVAGCGGEQNPTITGPEVDIQPIAVSIEKIDRYGVGGLRLPKFYLESGTETEQDLPVLITYAKDQTSEFVVIRRGKLTSDEFPLEGKTTIEEAWMRAKMPLPIKVRGGGDIPLGYNFQLLSYTISGEGDVSP